MLALKGLKGTPVFKRSRISNQAEQVSMVVQEAEWLDQETILRKLPNIDPAEIPQIMERLEEEQNGRMGTTLMGAAAVTAGVATPEEAGVDPDKVFDGEPSEEESIEEASEE